MDNGQDNELFIGLLNNAFPTPQNIKRKWLITKLFNEPFCFRASEKRNKSQYVKILPEAFVENFKGAIRPMIYRDRKTRKAQWGGGLQAMHLNSKLVPLKYGGWLALLVWSAPLTPPRGTPRTMQPPSGTPPPPGQCTIWCTKWQIMKVSDWHLKTGNFWLRETNSKENPGSPQVGSLALGRPPYLLAYSVEQSPILEVNRLSASQEIPCLLWNPKFITSFRSARHLSLSWARSIPGPRHLFVS
jgi:hypothetical protein